VATAPILASAIGAVPLGGVLLSLPGGLAVAGAIVPLVCGLLAWPLPPLSNMFLDGAWHALAALVSIDEGALPAYAVSLAPHAWGATMCAAAAVIWVRTRRWTGAVLVVGLGVCAVLLPMRPVTRAPELIVFDVGNAESLLLKLPDGEDVLIDCGREGHGAMLARAVRAVGGNPSRIVITHPHADHDGGLEAVARAFPGAQIVSYVGDVARRRHRNPGIATARVQGIARGDTLWWGGERDRLVCLHPSKADTSLATNERSIVFALRWRGRRMLLTGDLEYEGLRRWRERDGEGEWLAPGVDLLKLGHHGSPAASPGGFIDDVRAQVAVVSTARPLDPDLAQALRRSGTTVASTARSGAIRVRLETRGVRAWGWWGRWFESSPIRASPDVPGPLSLRPLGGA
jgi:competence protein ComEC